MSRRRPSTTLYLRNIPYETRHEDIRRAFSKFGPLNDVTIPLDYYTGQMKGFAFVEFESSRDAEDAQHRMDGTRFLGRDIDVEFSRGIRKTPSEMRLKTRRRRDDRHRSRSRSRNRSKSPSPRRRRRSPSADSRASAHKYRKSSSSTRS